MAKPDTTAKAGETKSDAMDSQKSAVTRALRKTSRPGVPLERRRTLEEVAVWR